MYALKFKLDEQSEYRIEKFSELPCKIGRGLENSILVDSDKISGKHATIYKEEDVFYIKDDDSTNGIIINKAAVTHAILTNGNKFQLGDIEFQFFIEDMDLDKTVVMNKFLLIPRREIYNGYCKKIYLSIVALLAILLIQYIDAIETGPLNKELWADLALSTMLFLVSILFLQECLLLSQNYFQKNSYTRSTYI